MNRRCYRLVFNAARGQVMVVSETAAAVNGRFGSTPTPKSSKPNKPAALIFNAYLAINTVAWAVFSLGLATAQAQIKADTSAPGNQRPTVLTAPNGVPLVNIQTPSAAGVSRNSYSQFDVQQQGAILNNSRSNVQTQLGGWVQGNAALAGGSARIILNEVHSNNPSLLRGYVEVAGQRAQVVIANPAGISCDGCGFINANRVTLSTGTPILNNGNLDAYRVQGGTVSITGLGLDASTADYTDILARAAQINAGIWAQQLKVVTGANHISVDPTSSESSVNHTLAGTGSMPAFGIDSSLLGGMYAGKITLIANEAGVGVRNAGKLYANAGDVRITVEGPLQNSGSITAQAQLDIRTTGDMQNTGTVYAQGHARINASGNISNSQTLAAQGDLSLSAQGTISQSSTGLMAGGLQPDNTLGSTGNLSLNAGQSARIQGSSIAAGNAQISAVGLDISQLTAQANNLSVQAQGDNLNASSAQLYASGQLSLGTDKTLSTDQATVQAGNLNIGAHDLSNIGGQLIQTGHSDLLIQLPGTFNNTGGRLASNSTNLSVLAGLITNTHGLIEHAGLGNLTLQADTINSPASSTTTNGTAVVQASTWNHDNASLQANALAIDVHNLNNAKGKISANRDANISVQELDNTGGQITALRDTTLAASGTINNTDGNIQAGRDVKLSAQQLDNRNAQGSASLQAGNTLNANVAQTLNNDGTLQATHTATVSAGTLNNKGTLAGKDLALTATTLNNSASGKILDDAMTLTVRELNNQGSIVGGSVTINANNLSNQGPSAFIGATDGMNLYITNSLSNTDNATVYSLGDLNIAANSAQDAGGVFIHRTAQVTNNAALIQADGNLQIATDKLLNTRTLPDVTTTTSASAKTLNKRAAYWMCEYGYYIDNFAGACAQSYADLSWYNPSTADIYINPLAERHGMWINGWYVETSRTTTTTVSEQQWAAPLQTEPKILAGGNIAFNNVSVLSNAYGSIQAGGNATIGNPDPSANPGYTTSSVSNTGAQLTRTTQIDESSVFRWNVHYGNAASVSQPSQQSTQVLQSTGGVMTAGGTFSISADSVSNTNALPGQSHFSGAATPGPAGPLGASTSLPTVASLSSSLSNVGSVAANASLNASLAGTLVIPPPSHPARNYLIESNPAFSNYRSWLSSDYLLAALGLDPAATQKRLGDGFYEQRLIQDQIGQLTGRRFLAGYASNEAEYQALMQSGVTVAQAFHLTPGIALTADQIKALTSDIIWLVQQSVTLTDGSQTSALVPVVYLSQIHTAQLQPTGAVIAGQGLNINTPTLTHNGALRGDGGVTVTANTLTNNFGTIDSAQGLTRLSTLGDLINTSGLISGQAVQLNVGRDLLVYTDSRSFSVNNNNPSSGVGTVTGSGTELGPQGRIASQGNLLIQAGRDISLTGAQVQAQGDAALMAGQNLSVNTTQAQYSTLDQSRFGTRSAQGSTNLASSLQTGGNLTLASGSDTTLQAAQVSAGQNLTIQSGGQLNISTASNTTQLDEHYRASGYVRDDHSQQNQVIGSQLTAQGSINLSAQKDLTVQGSSVNAQTGQLNLSSANNINIIEARETGQYNRFNQTSGSKTFSSKTQTERDSGTSDIAVGSALSGLSINISAGKDIRVRGSSVVSDNNTVLQATNNITLEAAQNQQSASSFREEKKSGLMSSGGGSIGFTVGSKQQSTDQQNTSTSAAASTVGSIKGNVNISAGKQYTQVGSDVMAPAGNVTIQAQSVTIEEARETSQSATEQQFKQSGITVGISNPLISAGQTAQSLGQAAGNTSDPRMQALAAAAAGLNGYNTYSSLTDKAGNFSAAKAADISINISIGSSRSQSNSASQSDTARGSTVTAGNNISIKATGANQDSNLTVQGSQVQAGNNVALSADNQINLLAAQNTASQTSSNSSSSSSVGVSYSPATGWGVNASASRGQGRGNGSDVSYTNTQVQAGNTAAITSGGDTNIKGAVVAGNTIKADVGGNLAIESLQDTSTYTSRQSSSGGSISFGGGKLTGGGISVGRSHIDSNFASVNQQSGIQAGDGGFQVSVNNNTDLKGAVIASTQAAIDQNRNSFTTGGTLTTSDIQNSAEYKGEAIAVSASIGPKNTDPKGNTTYLPGGGFGVGSAQGQASSTTTAGISGLAGNTAVRTGDMQTGIGKIFNAARIQQDIDAQVTITAAFGQNAAKAWGDYANQQQAAAPDAQAAACWAESGACRGAGHILIGGLGGGVSGAAGAGAAAFAADAINQATQDLPQSLKTLVGTGIALSVGAAVGGLNGAAAAFNEDVNNRQLHETEKQRIKVLAQGNKALEQQLTEAACYLTRCAAAKNLDDPTRAALQAQSDAVAQNAGGQYNQALALLQPEQASGLFTYSSADQALDQSIRLDPRSSSRFQGLSQTEQEQKDNALQACQSAACTAQVQADYQRIASNRAEHVLALDNVLQLSANCQTDSCRRDALAQMQAFNNDLKAQGLGPEDSNRLALRAHIAAIYTTLGNPGDSLEQFAAALIGAMGSEAGNKGNVHGVTSGGTANAVKGAQLQQELSALTRIAPDFSQDAQYVAKTDKSILTSNNFDMNHVLAGEINPSGRATGYHAEFAADGAARITPGATVKQNSNGTYEAPVQVFDAAKGQWVDKARDSTFFPPSWSQARIEYEVSQAFKSRNMLSPTQWRGTTPSGVQIQGYINSGRVTFYPLGN